MVQIVCPHCSFSKSVPEEKIPPGAKTAVCPRCRQRFEIPASERQVTTAPKGDGARSPSPWERRSELGLGKSLSKSVKGILFSPTGFFRKAAVEGGIKEPLAFGILAGSLGMMFEIFWQGLIEAGELPSLSDGAFGKLTWGPVFMGIMVLCPLFVTIFLCVTSLVLHFLLVIVRGGKNGFEATFRAVSYSLATQLWAVIPFVGSLLALMWIMVVQVVSLKEMHGVTYARVVLAMLIPLMVVVMTIAAVLIPFLMSV
jgi:predicted Zn finger-like uncharacterized protein